MKIRMLEDAPGSPDGVTVNQYAKGETYDLSELGATFLAQGVAERVDEKAKPAVAKQSTRHTKKTAPPENK